MKTLNSKNDYLTFSSNFEIKNKTDIKILLRKFYSDGKPIGSTEFYKTIILFAGFQTELIIKNSNLPSSRRMSLRFVKILDGDELKWTKVITKNTFFGYINFENINDVVKMVGVKEKWRKLMPIDENNMDNSLPGYVLNLFKYLVVKKEEHKNIIKLRESNKKTM